MTDSGPRHRAPKAPRRRRRAVDAGGAPSARELSREARTLRARSRRRRVVAGAVTGIAVLGAAVGYSFIDRPDPVEGPAPEVVTDASGASALVAVVDASGRAMSTALFATHEDVRDRILLFPPSLLTIQPGFGEHQLADATRLGDSDLLAVSVINLLGVRVDDVLVLDEAHLIAALAGPLEVDLAAPFVVDDGDVQRVAAAAGDEPRTPELVFRLLTDAGPEAESAMILRQGRVWEAIVAELAADEDLLDRIVDGRSESVRVALAGVAQDSDRIVAALPTVTAESVAGAGTQVIFDTADTQTFVTDAFPYLQIAPEPRPVLELLNGNGGVGVTQPVAERLVEAGYRVLKTDNADRTDFAATQVIAHGRENEEAALALQRLLGFGDVVLEIRQPSAVFDITIIVGNDFAQNGS